MNQMFNTIGERISYCRSLLGLTRKEFIELIGTISHTSLTRWELGYVKDIPISQLDKLIIFLNSQGIIVSKEWVLLGTGNPPINSRLKNLNEINFDEVAYLTLSQLKSHITEFQIFQINTNFFEPVLCHGDYIGGIIYNKNISQLTNQLCFIIDNGIITTGIFDFSENCLGNLFNNRLYLKDKFIIGKITWIAKRH